MHMFLQSFPHPLIAGEMEISRRGNANLNKKREKSLWICKKPNSDEITENQKNDVFRKIMLNLKICQKMRKSSVKEGDIDMSQKT